MKRAETCGPVAIQGHAGSFSEAAARAYFSPETQLVSQPDFKALFASVGRRVLCTCGVVPIENSLMGSIHENYDLLLQSDVHIVGEIKLRIVHNLIVNRGVQLADIRYIASQPPALAQCTRFIHSLADAQTIAADDTAGAVKELAASGARDRGAIAGAHAAAAYGMEILVPGIEDAPHNFTRFLVVNRCAASAPAEPAKTTLVFGLKHVPGALCRSLAGLCRARHQPAQNRVAAHARAALGIRLLSRFGGPLGAGGLRPSRGATSGDYRIRPHLGIVPAGRYGRGLGISCLRARGAGANLVEGRRPTGALCHVLHPARSSTHPSASAHC